jgi:hypothetical protein
MAVEVAGCIPTLSVREVGQLFGRPRICALGRSGDQSACRMPTADRARPSTDHSGRAYARRVYSPYLPP